MIPVLAFLGIVLSIYMIDSKKGYNLFGYSSSSVGLFYYIIVLIFSFIATDELVFILSVPAIAATLYLIYQNIRSRNFCWPCVLAYFINFGIFFLAA